MVSVKFSIRDSYMKWYFVIGSAVRSRKSPFGEQDSLSKQRDIWDQVKKKKNQKQTLLESLSS